MPMFIYTPPAPVVEVPDTGVSVDAEGWLLVPGQLPTKNIKETLANGNTKYSILMLDTDGEHEPGEYPTP